MTTAQSIVDLLNAIHALDPKVLYQLFEHRVPIDPDGPLMRSDLPIVVGGEEDKPALGLLGILNGLVSDPGGKMRVTAVYDDDLTTLIRLEAKEQAHEPE